MNNKLTYIEARDKIWNAYFRDEIRPGDQQFCFCGTLCDNTSDWFDLQEVRHYQSHGYSGKGFVMMEKALFKPIRQRVDLNSPLEWENALFAGMLAALEVLKQIHRERGDYIPEDEPLLTKRNLPAVAE